METETVPQRMNAQLCNHSSQLLILVLQEVLVILQEVLVILQEVLVILQEVLVILQAMKTGGGLGTRLSLPLLVVLRLICK